MNNIAANEKLNNLLQGYDDVNFALDNSYIEEANKAINTPKDFDVIIGGTYTQLEARIDEIKDFLIDCEKLFENTSLEIQKKWKDFLEILNKKNIARKECLLLPIRTVLKALDIR